MHASACPQACCVPIPRMQAGAFKATVYLCCWHLPCTHPTAGAPSTRNAQQSQVVETCAPSDRTHPLVVSVGACSQWRCPVQCLKMSSVCAHLRPGTAANVRAKQAQRRPIIMTYDMGQPDDVQRRLMRKYAGGIGTDAGMGMQLSARAETSCPALQQ
jgi:hypothetical protein